MAAEPLREAVREVGRFLVSNLSLGETLERIAFLVRDAIPPAAAVGMTLLDQRDRPTTVVFADDAAPAVDRAQYDSGDGPCLTAYRERRVLRVDDVDDVADRWPAFSREARRQAIASAWSFPLVAGDEAFGALNVYSRDVGGFAALDEEEVAAFVIQAAVVLANASAYWAAFDLASNLEEAMRSRAVIEQAKGKIMADNGCSADEAFAILVRASQRENVKVRELARQVVESSRRA